jgi:hypothetical protein
MKRDFVLAFGLMIFCGSSFAMREVYGVVQPGGVATPAGAFFDTCASVRNAGDYTFTISNPVVPAAGVPAQARQKVTIFLYKPDGTATSPAQLGPAYLNPGQSEEFEKTMLNDPANGQLVKIQVETVDPANTVIPDAGVVVASGAYWRQINNQCKSGLDHFVVTFAGGRPF